MWGSGQVDDAFDGAAKKCGNFQKKAGGKTQIGKTEMLNTLFNHYHTLRELWIKYSVGRKNWWSRVLALNKPS